MEIIIYKMSYSTLQLPFSWWNLKVASIDWHKVIGYSWIITLRKKCPYSELFWSAFFRILIEYGEIRNMWENVDQNNSEYGHLLRSVNKHNYFRRSQICQYRTQNILEFTDSSCTLNSTKVT